MGGRFMTLVNIFLSRPTYFLRISNIVMGGNTAQICEDYWNISTTKYLLKEIDLWIDGILILIIGQ